MLSSVLRTRRAIEANITIMRTFVRLRQMLLSNEGLGRKLAALEKTYDANVKVVFDAIRELMSPPSVSQTEIGFRPRPRNDPALRERGTHGGSPAKGRTTPSRRRRSVRSRARVRRAGAPITEARGARPW